MRRVTRRLDVQSIKSIKSTIFASNRFHLTRLDNRLKSTQVDLSRLESIIVLSRLSEKVDLKSTQVDFKST
ncbi:hypothetical protein B9Z55_015751 [Caenorhabditis nigoni]|uniref:Uncharacterized protein n=1 Tax=Caenorhabditis nigoni TaxID=1611254 RepID=A0A2G5UBK8_9PELO|nr:hypothetical protein B9Z55_015751 [Caenorhabditis nigoni]